MGSIIAALIAALGLAGLYVYGLATSTPKELAKKSYELAQCKRDLNIRDSREASFRRMIDRRDEAIKYSNDAKRIQDWVRNPHKIPKPFNPFKDSPLAPPK